MSRRLAAALLVAFIARAGIAVLTEYRPIFPPYYYTDAHLFDRQAREVADYWSTGVNKVSPISPDARLYTVWVAALYHTFGERPLLPKLANALAAVAAIGLWGLIASSLYGPAAGALTAWLLALWPSHVFYSGQNLKDPAALLLIATALWAFIERRQNHRTLPVLLAASLLALGFFRSYLVLLLSGAFLLAAAWEAWADVPQRRALALRALGILAALALARPTYRLIFGRVINVDPHYHTSAYSRGSLLPETTNPRDSSEKIKPLSPRALSAFRSIRHSEDRWWADKFYDRRIGTQIFPEVEFRTWGDVLVFLPKGWFHALFMPLPGLYPLEGKMSRALASAENLVLLATAVLGALGFVLLRRSPQAWALISLFAACSMAYGLLEFDLGSATRHRLQHLPCLFPFAAAWLAPRLKRLAWSA